MALALLAPLLVFGLGEAALRLAGFGHDPRFFIPDPATPGADQTNPRFTERFFPASFGLKPANFRLSRHKPPGTTRVFVLGESAALGVPEPAFGLAPQLRAQWRAAAPGRSFEVFSLGVTAINSHAIRLIARQALDFEPDLLVLYMGNNEMVGPYGASAIATGGTPPLPLIRASLALRATRLGQALQRLAAAVRPAGAAFREWRGMAMFAGRAVSAADPSVARVHAHFAANLADILAAARYRGVPVLLSTVAVNVRDTAPFASEAPVANPAVWQREFALGVRAAALEEPAAAARHFTAALAAGPDHAETHHRLARAAEALGDASTARRHYLAALEHDALRFRADSRINASIRAAAAAAPPGTVVLVDAAEALGATATATATGAAPPAGHTYFFEHVHLTFAGNHALARLLAAAGAPLLGLPAAPAAPDRGLDAAAAGAALGFTPVGQLALLQSMAELTDRPPFTGRAFHAEDRAWLERETAAAAAALAPPEAARAAAAAIDRALAVDPANPHLPALAARAWLQAGDHVAALARLDRLAALEPWSPEQAAQRAFALRALRRTGEAETALIEAAARAPFYFQTYGLLAGLWLESGQAARAVTWFRARAAAMPGSRGVRTTLAGLLARAGDWPAAEREWSAVLAGAPDDEAALAPLVERLGETGRIDEAEALMLRAAAANPRSFANEARLADLYLARDDLAAAARHLEALVASGPVNSGVHLELVTLLRRLGRADDARPALLAARRAAREEDDASALARIAAALAETPAPSRP